MKKERECIVRDPRLKRVRNEIRALLRAWCRDVRSSLNKVFLAEDNSDKSKEIHNRISELDVMERKSIILCPDCGRRDQDMAYVPSMNEWICVECNSKRVYFDELKEEVLTEMTMTGIKDFLERLSGGNGIELSRFGSKCNGYEDSKRILNEMGVGKDIQDKFLELCSYYGGHCDCEILLNAERELLKK
ncbi:hypothetical protein LCGC14_1695550 [marine sediment metagenome]|uniref:DUF2695 domain-containing protein n=1 Tax=marine sediment metagenome TaxID=412755 RepID=A0A0F9HJB9_9ZZZZ|nr:hypothetical protein [bacterium]